MEVCKGRTIRNFLSLDRSEHAVERRPVLQFGQPNSDKLLAHLRTYPEAVRARTSMKQAMADYFIRNYPCR